MDLLNRYEHGEFFTEDSIHQDESTVYKTSLGRTVYGGGGIMPDIFVPQDTTAYTSYYKSALMKGMLQKFAFHYTDTNRSKLNMFDSNQDLLKYLKRQNLLEQFARYADERGLKRRNNMMMKSKILFEEALYGNIIYDVMGLQEYIQYLNEHDDTVIKAVEILESGRSYPVQSEENIANE